LYLSEKIDLIWNQVLDLIERRL